MKILTETRNPWHDWLIKKVKQKIMDNVKDKIMSISKTNTKEEYSNPTLLNNVYGGGKKLRKAKIRRQ